MPTWYSQAVCKKKRMDWDAAPKDASYTGRRASTLLVRRVEIPTLLLISHIAWVEASIFRLRIQPTFLRSFASPPAAESPIITASLMNELTKRRVFFGPAPISTILVHQCF